MFPLDYILNIPEYWGGVSRPIYVRKSSRFPHSPPHPSSPLASSPPHPSSTLAPHPLSSKKETMRRKITVTSFLNEIRLLPTLFYSRLLDRHLLLKTTWTVFPPLRIFPSYSLQSKIQLARILRTCIGRSCAVLFCTAVFYFTFINYGKCTIS